MATDDLLTEDEARRFLGIGMQDSSKSALLRSYITASSRLLTSRVGTIIYGTVTGELHDGGGPCVYLDNHPVQGVVTVVEYDGTTAATLTAETNASKPDTAYKADLDNGKITRRNGNSTTTFPTGIDNVYVTYVAGRAANTAAVDDRFKVGCGLILKHAWRAHEPVSVVDGDFDVPNPSFPRFAIPNAVRELLADDWRAGSGIGD